MTVRSGRRLTWTPLAIGASFRRSAISATPRGVCSRCWRMRRRPPSRPSRFRPRYGLYAYYNNLGVQLRGQGKLKDATEAFQQAIELNPDRPVPYLNLAMVLFDRQDFTDSNEVFLE